jgi:6-phosphogluconolactonase
MALSMAPVPSQQHVRWHGLRDLAEVHAVVTALVLAAASEAARARGRFSIVLAGGETPRGLYERLRSARADWSAWHVYFGDERCVGVDDEARNSRMAALAWLDHVPIPRDQIHPIPAELGAVEGAARYERVLAGIGPFDVLLLGLGEDGHVGSLFPGHDLGSDAAAPSVLPVLDAPKPPPMRISLSAARFSRARQTSVLVAGEGKRGAVQRWRSGAAIPAAAIVPASGVDVFIESALLDS